MLFLGACSFSPTPEIVIVTATPTPTPTQMMMPAPANTSTPPATATPQPPIPTIPTVPQPALTYTLHIDNPASGTARVEIVYYNPPRSRAELGLGERGFPIPTITQFQAVDQMGNSLPTADLGASQRFGSVRQIDVGAATAISITYDVDLNSLRQCGNILQSTYGAVEPEYTFYRPARTYDGPIALILDLPTGWPVVSIHNSDSGIYQIHSLDNFISAPVAFGAFHTSTHVIGNVTMTLAFQDGIPNSLESDITHATTRIFDYFTLTIGDLSASLRNPRTNYLIVFLPQATNKVSTREGPYGYAVHANSLDAPYWSEIPGATYVSWQAHMIGHAWQPGTIEGPFWFSEGITTFYQFRAVHETGLQTDEQYQRVMISLYRWYANNVLGTEDDISLAQASRYTGPYDEEVFRINYWKAALVVHILNEALTSVTEGSVTFDDVMHYLYQKYVIESSNQVSEGMILDVVNNLSGRDFRGFFDDYIYGNEPLPCRIEGDRLVIDFGIINIP